MICVDSNLLALHCLSDFLQSLLSARVWSLNQGRLFGFCVLVLNGAIWSKMDRHLPLKEFKRALGARRDKNKLKDEELKASQKLAEEPALRMR